MKIELSKMQWKLIGKKAGWLDESPKMMPGDTPYSESELKSLYKNVNDVAGADINEENEDDFISRRRTVRVTFNNGDKIISEINGSKEEIEKYYLPYGTHGEWTDYDVQKPDKLHRPIKVEFLS